MRFKKCNTNQCFYAVSNENNGAEMSGNTNADMKIPQYVCAHVKSITRKFRMLNPKNSGVICP